MRGTKQTLAWVNGVRAARGLQPLDDLCKGNHSVSSCPIANSLKGDDYAAVTTTHSKSRLYTDPQRSADRVLQHPRVVESWIAQHDKLGAESPYSNREEIADIIEAAPEGLFV